MKKAVLNTYNDEGITLKKRKLLWWVAKNDAVPCICIQVNTSEGKRTKNGNNRELSIKLKDLLAELKRTGVIL